MKKRFPQVCAVPLRTLIVIALLPTPPALGQPSAALAAASRMLPAATAGTR